MIALHNYIGPLCIITSGWRMVCRWGSHWGFNIFSDDLAFRFDWNFIKDDP